jgi:hypothetical protein
MAPLRTISDAVFAYTDRTGAYATARRGQTVDIPEGDDLKRGDSFGAFMAEVNEEPPPPADTKLVTPEVGWSAREFDNYIDAAHISEIRDELGRRAELDRAPLALQLLEAENRKANPRQTLVTFLNETAGIAPTGVGEVVIPGDESPTGTTPPPAGVAGEVTPSGTIGDPALAEVTGQPVDQVVAYAKENPDQAAALLELEQAKDSPRKGVLEGLAPLVEQ